MNKNKNAQEEIMGFGIILIVIAVIALVFISLSVNKNRNVNDEPNYEVNGFLSALMEKTTTCEKNSNLLAVKDIIFECGRNRICANGENSCDVLNETVTSAMDNSWKVENGSLVKGYYLVVYYEGDLIINETRGVLDGESRGAWQDYAKSAEESQIILEIFN
jgi:hypothetical protein